jgi:UDP:flavonoid glycosyltransferase YjiC (YdhE family)
MRVLAACSLGGAGHFEPLRPWLEALDRRGDEVAVAVPPALEPMVSDAGFRSFVGGEPPEDQVAPIREVLPTAPPEEAARLASEELFGRMATAGMLPGMTEVAGDWRPDLILRDPTEYASAVVACRFGIPSAQIGISLATVEDGALRLAAHALDGEVVEHIRRSPYLTRFPASLDPSPFADTRRYREELAQTASDASLVYVSFGTVLGHMERAADVYNATLNALADLDAPVLLTVGRKFDVSRLAAIPNNVRVEAWVPQAEVFPKSSVVVCHGGSGTAFGALAGGLPLVIVPFFADQRANGERIAESGAGVVIQPSEIHALAGAITRVLTDANYRHAAGGIASEIQSVPPIASFW